MSEGVFVFPLSFAQRRLWFLHELEPGNTFYNLPFAVPFKVAVNPLVLERSINEIVNRHEMLRTVFDTVDGEPMQIIRPRFHLDLTVVDLRTLSKDEQAAQTTRATNRLAQQPFDLAHGPLLRAALVQHDAHDHVFVLVMHHIIADGWSFGVFWRELVALYNAFYINLPSPLVELPIQYADFAVWQRERLQGERLAALADYWKRQLAGLPTLQLSTDRPRPPVLSYRGAFQEITVPRALAGALKALSQREGATLFMTLFAAFAVLLQRYCGQDDIVVGAPVASRDRKELEGLIGFFVNTLVLRVDLSGDPQFRDLLARVRETALDAYAHQELPFEKLVEELRPERDLSRNPLFQVSFQLFSAPDGQDRPGPSEQAPTLVVNRGSAIFDIAVNLWEAGDAIGGHFEYSTDLFDPAFAARLVGHFKTLLKSISANPNARISQLELLAESERRQMLIEWNNTELAVPPFCVHELFEQQAARRPGALAVSASGESLTYGELDQRANTLAHRLRALGVGRGSLVCVCAERNAATVVGLLAILKADGAYVPLDPSYPPDRLAFMLEDSGAKVILTDRAGAGRLTRADAAIVRLDDASIFPTPAEASFERTATPDDVCYVIYTSGSTGRPKGVLVPHRGLMNLVAWHRKAFAVSPADRASQVASLAFDACGWELWPYLTAGASVHIIPDEARTSAPDLAKALIESKITIGFVPTPLAQMLFDDLASLRLQLRYLLTGGDKLTQPAPAGCDFTVTNNYGPTECSVVTTSCELDGTQGVTPPIGRPIANTQVYVLDRHLHPVPIGVVGELYVGGRGLALGYHNLSRLSDESFIVNPIPGAASPRLYKTGDLVRYRDDGTLEYHGRSDQQIKIRGFRVELGEIETALVEHKEVSDAVVAALPSEAADNDRLVAYVVRKQTVLFGGKGDGRQHSDQTLIEGLRAHLRTRLPDYMLPAAFVVLEQLPQTANGKVDRRALPLPQAAHRDTRRVYAEPRTEIEQVLIGIWAEVLDLDRVGVDDNFFEIGGHSLRAARLVSRVRDRLKVEVPVQTLFRSPTPAQFAASLVADAPDPADLEKIARLVVSLSALSDAEVKTMLARSAAASGQGART